MAQCLIQASTLTAIAQAIRAKKGVQTLYKPGQMAQAIAAISTGDADSGIQIGDGAQAPSFMALFEALEQGNARTGTFLAEAPLESESPMFLTGLPVVRGILLVDVDRTEPTTGRQGAWLGLVTMQADGTVLGSVCLNGNGDTGPNLLPWATWRLVDGIFAVTPSQPGDPVKAPFCLGHNYRWVAW